MSHSQLCDGLRWSVIKQRHTHLELFTDRRLYQSSSR